MIQKGLNGVKSNNKQQNHFTTEIQTIFERTVGFQI